MGARRARRRCREAHPRRQPTDSHRHRRPRSEGPARSRSDTSSSSPSPTSTTSTGLSTVSSGLSSAPPRSRASGLCLPTPRWTLDVDGLDRIDALVLKLAGDEAIRDFEETGSKQKTSSPSLREQLEIEENEAIESLEVLDADGYIELHRTMGRGLPSMRTFKLTMAGMETYAAHFVEDYETFVSLVVSQLMADRGRTRHRSCDSGFDRRTADARAPHPSVV